MKKEYSRTINELVTDEDLKEHRRDLVKRASMSHPDFIRVIKKVTAAEKVVFIVTPGHGYLEVPDTPENRKFFTQYDYERGGKLYLEEDDDAPKWLDAHGIKDFTSIKTVYAEDHPEYAFLIH